MTRNLGQVDSHCLLISAVQFLANGLTISFISYTHSVPGKIVKLFVSKQKNILIPNAAEKNILFLVKEKIKN
jgi:hypothetical protein